MKVPPSFCKGLGPKVDRRAMRLWQGTEILSGVGIVGKSEIEWAGIGARVVVLQRLH